MAAFVSRKKIEYTCLGTLIALSAPMAIMVAWQMFCASDPIGDEVHYAYFSREVFHYWQAAGLWPALNVGYFHAHQRPVIHPLLDVLFFRITGGEVGRAILISRIFYYVTFLYYCFHLARLSLRRTDAVLLTWSIALVPWVYSIFSHNFSEGPQLAFTVAAAFYFRELHSRASVENVLKFSLFLSLAICSRPAESGLFFLILLSLQILHQVKSGALVKRDLLMPILLAGIAIAELYAPYRYTPVNWPPSIAIALFLFLVLMATLGFFYVRSNRLNVIFFLEVALPILLVAFWFLPKSVTLFIWIYNVSGIADDGFVFHVDVLYSLLRQMGYVFPILLFIALCGVKNIKSLDWSERILLATAVAIEIIYTTFCLITNHLEFRYQAAFFGVASIVSLMLGLRQTRVFLRFSLASLLVALILLELLHIGHRAKVLDKILIGNDMNDLDLRATVGKDIGRSWAERMSAVSVFPRVNPKICYLDFHRISTSRFHVQAYSLSLWSLERGTIFGFEFDPPSLEREEINSSYDYVMFGPVSDIEAYIRRPDHLLFGDIYDKFILKLYALWRANTLGEFDLRFASTLSLPSSSFLRNGGDETWVVLNTNKSQPGRNETEFHIGSRK